MSKSRNLSLEDSVKKEIMGNFITFLDDLEDKREVISFFMNNLTDVEIMMLAKRFLVAKKIIEGRDYEKISSELSVGRGTLTRIRNELEDNESYSLLLKKYFFKDYTNEIRAKYRSGLAKYPGHKLAMKVLGIDFINKKIFGED